MSPTRPVIRIRPRSAIVDADIARIAVTDLPGTPVARRGLRPYAVLATIRALGRPSEPDRVIIMPRG